jgi:hypothetical protein
VLQDASTQGLHQLTCCLLDALQRPADVTNALAAGLQKSNADDDKAKVAGDQLANQLTSGDQPSQQAFSQALARAVATGGCGSVSQVLAGEWAGTLAHSQPCAIWLPCEAF